jgi:hypothetical protein
MTGNPRMRSSSGRRMSPTVSVDGSRLGREGRPGTRPGTSDAAAV